MLSDIGDAHVKDLTGKNKLIWLGELDDWRDGTIGQQYPGGIGMIHFVADDRLRVPHGPHLSGFNQLTIACVFFEQDWAGNGTRPIVSKCAKPQGASTDIEYYIQVRNQSGVVTVRCAVSPDGTTTNQAVLDYQWGTLVTRQPNFLVFTWDGTTGYLYIADGWGPLTLRASGPMNIGGPTYSGTSNLTWGSWDNGSDFHSGPMDNMRISGVYWPSHLVQYWWRAARAYNRDLLLLDDVPTFPIPVPSAAVELLDIDGITVLETTTADGSGRFSLSTSLSGLPKTLYLRASRPGFSTVTQPVYVSGSTNTIIRGVGIPESSIDASGTITIGAPSVNADADVHISVSGALDVTSLSISSDIDVKISTGGNLSLGSPALLAAASVVVGVDGSISMGSPSVSGQLALASGFSGGITLGSPSVSGQAEVKVSTDGSIAISGPTVDSDADVLVSAFGALTLGLPVVSGSVGKETSITGDITIGPPDIDAAASVDVSSDASITPGAPSVSGTVGLVVTADGSLSLASPDLSGLVVHADGFSGAIVMGSPALSGDIDAIASADGLVQIGTFVPSGGVTIDVGVVAQLVVGGFSLSSGAGVELDADGSLLLAAPIVSGIVGRGAGTRVASVSYELKSRSLSYELRSRLIEFNNG
ncbi:MAG: hypothetical protein KatS3mg104_2966 [Phycisphaerae bacterium]|nr:MAG: hypothetical protein KatS3mg104_2966 [Phycisphaerae bacterium]